jgi:hypothetical protein
VLQNCLDKFGSNPHDLQKVGVFVPHHLLQLYCFIFSVIEIFSCLFYVVQCIANIFVYSSEGLGNRFWPFVYQIFCFFVGQLRNNRFIGDTAGTNDVIIVGLIVFDSSPRLGQYTLVFNRVDVLIREINIRNETLVIRECPWTKGNLLDLVLDDHMQYPFRISLYVISHWYVVFNIPAF